MKILWISHFLPWPPHGGSPQRNYNLVRELLKEFAVCKVGFTQRAHYLDESKRLDAIEQMQELASYLKFYRIPTDYNRFSWLCLLAGNLFSRKPYSAWKFWSREFDKFLDHLLNTERFDIVYADTVATAPYALRARDKSRLVLNHHNIESSLLLRRSLASKNLLHRLYLKHQGNKMRRWEKRFCPQFDVNLTVSELDAAELIRHAPGARCEVIANGTDIEYFKPTHPATGHEMVFTGGGTWEPNRDAMSWFIREILPLIVARVPDAVMHVIGSNPPADVVRASEQDERIKVHGFVPDTRPYLARSSVYVVPIRIGGGTRLKIVDAFAAGKAVVSTSIGCEGIACQDLTHIRVADTPESFANTVVELFADTGKRRRLEQNARQLAEQVYSWNIIGARLRDLYRDLCAPDGSALSRPKTIRGYD